MLVHLLGPVVPLAAQAPPLRNVHPGIAPPAAGVTFPGLIREIGPMFQVRDGVWNHGEGFRPAPGPADTGGWHGLDDGTGVTMQDVHSYHTQPNANYPYQGYWTAFSWQSILHPQGQSPVPLRRFVGFLRPPNRLPLGTHPRYPGSTRPWVDNAAFEMIAPNVQEAWPLNPSSPQKIVLVVCLNQTEGLPRAFVTPAGGGPPVLQDVDWRNTYLGFFSPDGLKRQEAGTTVAAFEGNTAIGAARPNHQFTPVWQALGGNTGPFGSYYPICGHIVNTVHQRQTELVQQRAMQLVQAMKLILQDATMTPLWRRLTAQEVNDRVVVVFAGGSNGGQQACWAHLAHPDIVHGSFATTINPSIQRLFGEMEAGWTTSAMSGFTFPGSDFDPIDMRNWGHYAWIRGLEVHDLSLPRQHRLGNVWGPFCHYMGDEDITGTGTDIVPLLTAAGFVPSGISPSTHSTPLGEDVAWLVADKRNHNSGLCINPYNSAATFHEQDVALHLISSAVQCRAAQLAANVQPPSQPLPHLARVAGESMRGIDDPQEWAHGRLGQPVPNPYQPSAPLVRDDAFFNFVQPGAAGTWLASKGAALVRDQRVYIGEAGGVVSRFRVDWNHPKQPLVRDAKSQPLGHQAWAMASLASGSSWQLAVGTRRHLHKLDPASLAVIASVELPWERGMPYQLRVMDLLPNPGNEIVYASVHGGLCIHDSNLNFLQELHEPGIKDFAPAGAGVALMSERGVVAGVTFDSSGSPFLTASSVLQNGAPLGMVRANLVLPIVGQTPALVTLYAGDEKGLSLRVFNPADVAQVATVSHLQTMMPPSSPSGFGLGGQAQVTTVRYVEDNGEEGDHVLVLNNDELLLLNQYAQVIAQKRLYLADPVAPATTPTLYTPGLQVCAVAVGDLGNPVTHDYPEQVVVCGLSGQLSWVNVQDLLTPGFDLPSTYTMVTGTVNAVQPRASQSMSATWAIGRRPDDNLLHVLDQAGNYWQVDYFGNRTLVRREFLAALPPKRGWEFVGPVTATSATMPLAEAQVVPLGTGIPLASAGIIRMDPWCPVDNLAVVFEQQGGQLHVPFNWRRFAVDPNRAPSTLPIIEGFLPYPCTGSARPTPTQGDHDVFLWSGIPQSWPNLVEGLQLRSGQVSGIWASTWQPTTISGLGELTPYHDLRNEVWNVPYMNLQAVRTTQVGGQTYVVLGCPGGRVRILQPGNMRIDGNSHGLGPAIPSTSVTDDFGHGTCALAVRENTTYLDVFVGTFYGHPSPANYPAVPLPDNAVLAGIVRHLQWTPGSGFTTVQTYDLHPSAGDPRGGFGVVGLLVDDLISSNCGDELVVTTIEGDLFVYSVNTGAVLYRTWVPGALGFYNSIISADLNNNGKKELYLAGSYGLYRFVDPAEPPAENP